MINNKAIGSGYTTKLLTVALADKSAVHPGGTRESPPTSGTPMSRLYNVYKCVIFGFIVFIYILYDNKAYNISVYVKK